MSKHRRILIVGASSKIAQRFIQACPTTYEVYGTYSKKLGQLLPADRQFSLDLTNLDQVNDFLHQVSGLLFDAALFFASSYTPDPDMNEDYFTAYMDTIQLNAGSSVAIAKGLHFVDNSKVFLFGDAGLTHPKKGFTAYSISKFAIADIARLLAVELAPNTATFCLQLGPTLKENASSNKDYYRRSLLKIEEPVAGLVNLIHFLITEPNFNATGSVIDYDGGAYIKRAAT